jgi:hypothetical protein
MTPKFRELVGEITQFVDGLVSCAQLNAESQQIIANYAKEIHDLHELWQIEKAADLRYPRISERANIVIEVLTITATQISEERDIAKAQEHIKMETDARTVTLDEEGSEISDIEINFRRARRLLCHLLLGARATGKCCFYHLPGSIKARCHFYQQRQVLDLSTEYKVLTFW